MAHPEILVEEDHETDTRWITVNERHLPFYIAGCPVGMEPKPTDESPFSEDSPPDHSRWETFIEDPDGYARFKARQEGE